MKLQPIANDALFTAYPNPFNSHTQLSWTTEVVDKIEIFNALGAVVKTITPDVNQKQWEWTGKDSNGSIVPAGMYFVKLHSGTVVNMAKLIKL